MHDVKAALAKNFGRARGKTLVEQEPLHAT
jgi:hypothetical protein